MSMKKELQLTTAIPPSEQNLLFTGMARNGNLPLFLDALRFCFDSMLTLMQNHQANLGVPCFPYDL